jgi:hypothetical protein
MKAYIVSYLRRYDLKKEREGVWRREGFDLHASMNSFSSPTFPISILLFSSRVSILFDFHHFSLLLLLFHLLKDIFGIYLK